MLDEDQRELLALPELVHALDHAPALVGAHAGGRLVEQQHLGFEHQGERDVEQLLVAVRQVRGSDAELFREAEHLGDFEHAVAHLGRAESGERCSGRGGDGR